jgi:hypothetical protein
MLVAAALYARLAGIRLVGAVAVLGLPSPLFPLVTVTVPSTASATFSLLYHCHCAGVDGSIGAVGAAMCVLPVAVMCVLAIAVPRRLRLVAHDPRLQMSPPCVPPRLGRLLALLLSRRARWCDVDEEGAVEPAVSLLRRCATVVLLDYAAVWYAGVDVAVLTAACLLGAVSAVESAAACRGGAIAVLVLYGGLLALCAAARPFTTLFSHVYGLLSIAVSTIAVACQVWYLYSLDGHNVDLDALRPLLVAAALCDLFVAGISMVKTAGDGWTLLAACWRHVMALRSQAPREATEKPHCSSTLDGTSLLHLVDVTSGLPTDEKPLHVLASDDNDDFLLIAEVDESTVTECIDAHDAGIVTAREAATVQYESDLVRLYTECEDHSNNAASF